MQTLLKDKWSEYYRDSLSAQGKRFYDRIVSQFLAEEYSGVTLFPVQDHEHASADAFAAYLAVRDDHPEFFFLGIDMEFSFWGRTGALVYPILYPPETIRRIRNQLRKCIFRIVRGTADLPLIEKETIVYQRIAAMLTYTDNDDVRDHSVVGPVLYASGVCEGFNALLMLCLRRIGIPCIKVYARTVDDKWHCWTIASVYDEPVHCDVTMDRSVNGIVTTRYLNLSDAQIRDDTHAHIRGPVPACTTEAYTQR